MISDNVKKEVGRIDDVERGRRKMKPKKGTFLCGVEKSGR